MGLIGVAEAARRLRVSPQRIQQRIADGSLPASRVGGRWLLDAVDLPAPSVSRPLSARMAWALVAHLDGSPTGVSPAEQVRVRSYAARLRVVDDPAPLLRSWLARRGERLGFRAARPDLPDLRADERLRRSGVSADRSGIVAEDVVEAYVGRGDLADVVEDYFLVPADGGPRNVTLHVIADQVDTVTWPLLAADLAEYDGARERARVRELVRESAGR